MAMSSSWLIASTLVRLALRRSQIGTDCVTNGLGDGDGIWCVGVDAYRIGSNGDVVSGHRTRLAFGQGSQAPRCRVGRILGVVFARDDQATLGIVVEIGVVFGD